MRLKQIKLAGFKSFVDPTAFEVPGQLVGVVGPNGCGKSNIMDAVRWVLGESKASELRGESMQDVIFNGSSDRKPSVRASVELIFDNAQTRLTGAWAGYAELSVKRLLGRDGQSTYLINGQVVRRKDVHDMFLGTGLGPRAYAIIGQGTVSRIIEAKPEELRVFLEEAAGVSKYKERRRETENRLADTRENLLRVEDILRELGGQIEKLERQAEVAREYRELEADRLAKQMMLWLLRRDEALAEQQRIARQLEEVAVEIESRVAGQRSVEARLESARQAHFEASDAVHRAQGAYYEAHGEVARLEGEIRFVAESQTQLRERLAALQAQVEAARLRDEQASAALDRSEEELAAAEERQATLVQRLDDANAEVPALEDGVRDARDALDSARAQAAEASQRIQVAATRQRGLEDAMRQLRDREDRLREQLSRLGEAPVGELEALRERLAEAEAQEEGAGERVAEGEARWTEADARRVPAQEALREALARLAQVDARTQALRQLQERTRTQGKTAPWLAKHGLDQMRRLWQRLRIEPGWETAVESLLRERVQALEVGRLESLAGLLDEQPPAKVGFYAPPGPTAGGATDSAPGLVPLLRQVHTTDPSLRALLDDWLTGAYCAETAAQALADRERLPAGARFVLRAGHAIGRFGVQLYAMDSEQDGVLARQQELDNLVLEHRALELIADEARGAATRAESTAAQAKAQVAADRDALSQAVRRAAQLRLDTERCAQQVQRASADRARLDAELAELAGQLAEREAAIAEESARFESLDLELAERQEAVEAARVAWEDADAALSRARETLRELEREERESAFGARSIEARRQTLREQIEQARRTIGQAGEESGTLQSRLDELSDEAARAGLQGALDARVRAERELAEARARMDALAGTLRELDEARLVHERSQEPLRVRLTELQLKEQAARLGAEQYAEQLAQAEVDEPAVRARFETVPKPSWLQGEVTRLANAIAALGAVNLAALDELAASRERRDFLAEQSADLNEAIATLEDAIRRIDRETRALLQQTFDTVNGHFGRLFPELFGGGEARLVLTGDEILDAGVTVVAQPPGKRNSSVHLLSGGEKALTAIALVFAMFQLNPAPFCLLDEVDAPLDDANTERYCRMVGRMSEQTQFLFITHSKITMELAQQLVGVTMQERGVSRIVAVDLEAAGRFAEAA
ncbi:MAG TPA: chromosome segregation protein SMC [Burkholderiaceae bacterium]|nr:chromosome segregation protein SMC [Burkholderiaceae bacterium]